MEQFKGGSYMGAWLKLFHPVELHEEKKARGGEYKVERRREWGKREGQSPS